MKIYESGPAALISALYGELGIGKIIDDLVDWDPTQSLLSPGQRIKALIINIFGGRSPLYQVEEFYTFKDTENLFGKGIKPGHLKDYNLARSLDKLGNVGPQKVFSTISMNAICQEKVEVKTLHADTTSLSFAGQYEDEEENGLDFLKITEGHSKDHRPDLKQIVYGLAVTPDRIPVMGDINDGNTSDKTWNFKFIKKLSRHFDPEKLKDMIYVADSALITRENLELLSGATKPMIRFISRLPGTFSLEAELKERAWENNNWVELGKFSEKKNAASYKAQDFEDVLYGNRYRFIVVHSSNLDGRKRRSLDTKLKKEYQNLEKAKKQLEKNRYACKPDAELALQEFIKIEKPRYHSIKGKILAEEKRKPGRPPKDSPPKTIKKYAIKITIQPDQEAIEQARERLSCFVLITNLEDPGVTSEEILKEYKEQSSVETSFRFIKNPLYVGPIYLKNPERVESLSYVLLIALLMFYILERRARKAMKKEEEPLIIPGGVKTFKPTGLKILQSFKYIMVHTTDDPKKRAFPTNLKLPTRLLSLLGFEPDIYLDLPEHPNYFP